MKAYLLTLIATAVAVTLVGLLTPEGERGGLSKHIGLLSALCVVCVLIAPLGNAFDAIRTALDGELILPWEDADEESEGPQREQLQAALDEAGCNYFTEMLTQTLEQEFSIKAGEVRCVTFWNNDSENLRPEKITVLLSGSAIWKDAGAIEAYVTNLVGCECVSTVE